MGGKGYYYGDDGYSKGKVRLEEGLKVSTPEICSQSYVVFH